MGFSSREFWPIFASFRGDHIRKLILSPRKEAKIGSKEPEIRQNLSFATTSPYQQDQKETVYDHFQTSLKNQHRWNF